MVDRRKREWKRPDYEDMPAREVATKSLRAAIVGIPLGLVLLLIGSSMGYGETSDAVVVLGFGALLIGVIGLLRGLWHRVG